MKSIELDMVEPALWMGNGELSNLVQPAAATPGAARTARRLRLGLAVEQKKGPPMRPSIFDPEGPKTEHSGNVFTGPDANDISHMPADLIDGKVSEEETAEHEQTAATD